MAILIQGGRKIDGELTVQGAKNAVLPMIAAATLCDELVVLDNCPDITDVHDMSAVYEVIGGTSAFTDNKLILNGKEIRKFVIDCEAAERIRASFLFVGGLLGRFGKARVCYPGGCSIGKRPIDLHIEAFRKMGVKVTNEVNGIYCEVEKELHGAEIQFTYPSVGATENVVLLAVLAKGQTTIVNAAREPEVVDLCGLLKNMGALIEGEGTGCIRIMGVDRLKGTRYRVCSDRIVALTYAMFVAGCGGELKLYSEPVFSQKEKSVLEKTGCKLNETESAIYIEKKEDKKSLSFIKTGPYPQYPTDGQSLLMAVMCKGKKNCTIEETVFENRFRMIRELRKMGADIDTVSNRARINGVTKLHGANVDACDLRSGAGLMIAAAMADGESCIYNEKYVLRGYENLIPNLQRIGILAGKDE